MKFEDITPFTREGNWECDYTVERFARAIDYWVNDNDGDGQKLELNPDFQRGHVWTEEQQVAFIEYILRGGKSGRVVYLNNPSWQNWYDKAGAYNDFVCVDGLQRITAIRRFINNEIKAFGFFYNEFEDTPRHTLTMKVNINSLKTKKEVLTWYIEMNTGGVVHTKDEIDMVKELLEKES